MIDIRRIERVIENLVDNAEPHGAARPWYHLRTGCCRPRRCCASAWKIMGPVSRRSNVSASSSDLRALPVPRPAQEVPAGASHWPLSASRRTAVADVRRRWRAAAPTSWPSSCRSCHVPESRCTNPYPPLVPAACGLDSDADPVPIPPEQLPTRMAEPRNRPTARG